MASGDGAGGRGNKFHAQRAECALGGTVHTHDSLAERARHFILEQRQQAGEIRELDAQPAPLELVVRGRLVGRYRPDFTFRTADGRLVVLDVKSPATRRTEAWRLRKKLVEACWAPLTITEIE